MRPGIIVNSQHPLTLQRYTAAHEYGHHALGHDASADDESGFTGDRQNLQEVAAQAFAGEFLMPLQLVNYTLRTMGLPGQYLPLTARQMYQLALELGVSYGAAVTQLVGQHKLTVTLGSACGVEPARHQDRTCWAPARQFLGRCLAARRGAGGPAISPACATRSMSGCPRRRRLGTCGTSSTRPPELSLIADQFETDDDESASARPGCGTCRFRVGAGLGPAPARETPALAIRTARLPAHLRGDPQRDRAAHRG